ncbi:hypothetical protein [Paenibacillus sp. NPDC058174]|uniref:hypothetical protein n=1 Tax=Paenibacillus sp. NPDC058174 TaxID=3346366 RepID=UPI0036DB06C3
MKKQSNDPQVKNANKIKLALGGAIFCAISTAVVSLLVDSESLSFLVDVIVALALAFGVWKKSRVCAILLFVYFIISKLLQFSENPQSIASSIYLSIFLLFSFWQGIMGTFGYHRQKKLERHQPINTEPVEAVHS